MKKNEPLFFLKKLREIASLFGVEFPDKETDLIEDVSFIAQEANEIFIFLKRNSYLQRLIDSWRFSDFIGGLEISDREITIMLSTK